MTKEDELIIKTSDNKLVSKFQAGIGTIGSGGSGRCSSGGTFLGSGGSGEVGRSAGG